MATKILGLKVIELGRGGGVLNEKAYLKICDTATHQNQSCAHA